MNSPTPTFQIGKNGISESVVKTLNSMLELHKHVRISFLKSSGRSKENMKEMVDELVNKLNCPTQNRIIGFTVAIRRTAKADTKGL
ncbi:MAG: YhbY family RNA-binding protein [Nanoarchaeota archaeon]|nr:YhbY family RNA-binding protein [Nanoarchaeota archaeon]